MSAADTQLVPATVEPSDAFERFLATFVLPLVRGGACHVGGPLRASEVTLWTEEVHQRSFWANAIDEARRQVVAELVVRPPPMLLGGDEVLLAAGLYNALVLAHPRAIAARRKIRERVHATAVTWLRQPAPATRAEALGRHALLHAVFALTRVDTRLTWWSGQAEFRGTPAPGRLERMPRLRRVRKETEVLRFHELLLAERELPEDAVLALLASSPLTDLTTASRPHPPFFWSAGTVALLRDPELARAIAYLFAGGDEIETGALALRAAVAYQRFAKTSTSVTDVRTVTAFLLHVIALWTLGARNPATLPPALSSLEADSGETRDPGAAILCALPEAVAQLDNRLSLPPGMESAELAARWTALRTRARRMAGPEVAQLVKSLSRTVGRTPR